MPIQVNDNSQTIAQPLGSRKRTRLNYTNQRGISMMPSARTSSRGTRVRLPAVDCSLY